MLHELKTHHAGRVRMLWGHELTGTSPIVPSDDPAAAEAAAGGVGGVGGDGSVTAAFRTQAEGEHGACAIVCKVLVGCDGRESVVRECVVRPSVPGFEWKEHKGVMLHMMSEGVSNVRRPQAPGP